MIGPRALHRVAARALSRASTGALAMVVLLTAGCASLSPTPKSLPEGWTPESVDTGAVDGCRKLYRYTRKVTSDAGVSDAQAVTIPGFDYLRADRFSASFAAEALAGDAFDAWLDLLQELAAAGLAAELAALPDVKARPSPPALAACAATLRAEDFSNQRHAASAQALRDAIAVPDEYRALRRAAGLYWLTAWPVKATIDGLHRRLRQEHAAATVIPSTVWQPPAAATPLPAADVAVVLEAAYAGNALSIPQPSPVDRTRLFETFAPQIAIDALSDDDRIGAPYWPAASRAPAVDITRPTVYRHLSWTRYQGEILLQLNYVFWFPARPAEGAFDYLAGALDGLTWRVTLARDGVPLAYDAIHNCGCYHLFFATERSCLVAEQGTLQEPAFGFQRIDRAGPRLLLLLSPVEHFIQRVMPAPADLAGADYRFEDYDSLRALPAAGGHRSLFGADGIVPGTERGERFLLWPMGVPAPGAMRQFGHHATAFIGRRHFDDPALIERSFAPRPADGCPVDE